MKAKTYPIAKPLLDEAEAKAAHETVLSGWVAQGPKVKQFEEAFAAYVGAPYACAVSSGTTALHLALKAVGVGPGDVVITVSHSHIATANCIRYCFAEPLFIDIDPITYNLDAERLRGCLQTECKQQAGSLYYRHIDRLVTGESPLCHVKAPLGRVGAILVVHQMGFPCNLGAILDIARAYGLPVVEDAACAIGSEISFDAGRSWEKIGKPHGDVACFSFHPRKIITTGDGGMVTTRREALDRQVRLCRNLGMDISAADRHASSTVRFESYPVLGFNYRLTDIQAAIGIEQLKKLDTILDRRRYLATQYAERLQQVPWIQPVPQTSQMRPNWQSYPIFLLQNAPLGQVALMQHLQDCGIATRRGIMNAHQEPVYAMQKWQLPKSECARDRALLLPLYHELTEQDTACITNALLQAGQR